MSHILIWLHLDEVSTAAHAAFLTVRSRVVCFTLTRTPSVCSRVVTKQSLFLRSCNYFLVYCTLTKVSRY
ncbi:hypothetical protein EJ04DRAFT_517293 [Polyplosphaeria fusca]|uniref:Secreted protein n=1 Tax=Polyplosphaeria fusca TaxID=682080 RepID=A0A9P4UUN4_9PLEO|nr:hypothetical protein EJ04DRAFT_517293 [Polyplosphaeria fusca]